ncbi:hypothetical protein ACFOHW_00025 [Paenibacillus abyssi]|uniref:hypothetical protein n=1 Tax=Paenibacillus abyssi TaxID=1340531 RepID=UPI003613E591
MTKGRVWPTEWKRMKDRITDVDICQLTNYKAHSHHLYFTENGWYDNGQKLLFFSDRDNRSNLFRIDLLTGEILQLTDLPPAQPIICQLVFIRRNRSHITGQGIKWWSSIWRTWRRGCCSADRTNGYSEI